MVRKARKRLSVYLAGGMEKAKRLGSDWRIEITQSLQQFDVEILNPCEFEPHQLAGLQPNRLPSQFTDRNGKDITPKHWHELKLAPRDSALYRRFKKYMRRIINYDIGLVETQVDYVVCYWTEGAAAGAGTHSELTAAYRKHIPVYVVAECELPGWLEGTATEVFDDFDTLLKYLEEELGE